MKGTRAYFSSRDFPVLRDMIVLLSLFGGAFFLLLGRVGLIDPDEGRYSEMLENGDFITPTLNYVNYFEKSPIHYQNDQQETQKQGLSLRIRLIVIPQCKCRHA